MFASLRSGSVGVSVVLLFAISHPLSCGNTPASPASTPITSDDGDALEMRRAGTWLRSSVVRFDTAEPAGPIDDLEPLRQIVGNARIVSLGEATHGTSEFFKMKHRVLRFLVERMGFTAFAIEASWPEANRLDRYVRTGEGDPVALLSGLYFWTWNTQEVLDMVRWMRSYNQSGGNVGFYGFDMQFPGMAIDNIKTFVARVDGNQSADFDRHLGCLARHANDSRGVFPTPDYSTESFGYRDACLADLQWVADALAERQVQYETASSHAEWAVAAHSATVAIQYEQAESNRRSRDQAMADNVKWLVDEMPPDGKIVLWAHNAHVENRAGAMGARLREMFQDSMVIFGFDFARGSFNSRRVTAGLLRGPVTTYTVPDPVRFSYEAYFQSSDLPRFILDLRNYDKRAAGAAFLSSSLQMRSIGAGYDPDNPQAHVYFVLLPERYDVVIFFEDTTPSHILPFAPPPRFQHGRKGIAAAVER